MTLKEINKEISDLHKSVPKEQFRALSPKLFAEKRLILKDLNEYNNTKGKVIAYYR